MTDEATEAPADPRIAQLETQLAEAKKALREANTRANAAEQQVTASAKAIEEQRVQEYRRKHVLSHYLPPDLDLEAEARFAVGDVTFGDDGEPTGEIMYRPAAPAQTTESVPSFPDSVGGDLAAPAPVPQANPTSSMQAASAPSTPAKLMANPLGESFGRF